MIIKHPVQYPKVIVLIHKNNKFRNTRSYNGFSILACLCLLFLLQVLPRIVLAEEAKQKARVAILPFENISGQYVFIDDAMKPIYEHLDKTFMLSSYEAVDEVILQLRLRHTGFLSSQDALDISNSLGVDAIILGMICVYQEFPEPRVGLIMKMIGTGAGVPILWMNSSIISGNQTQTWFGRKRITKINSLFDQVVKDMLKDIPIDFSKEG